MQTFSVGNAKKKNQQYFLVNSNKIFIDPYFNEILCQENQIFVGSTKHFPGCLMLRNHFYYENSLQKRAMLCEDYP